MRKYLLTYVLRFSSGSLILIPIRCGIFLARYLGKSRGHNY